MSLPVVIDTDKKSVTVDETFFEGLPEEKSDDLTQSIDNLNAIIAAFANTKADVPPPPNHISGNTTQQVDKLRQTGVTALSKNKPAEAVKTLSLAIEMALKRPTWEATQYLIEQVCASLGPRADAYMAQNLWPDAYTDSALLTLLKPMEAKNHYRKGRCLQVVQKYSEAKAAYATGLATDPNDSELKQAMKEIKELLGEQS